MTKIINTETNEVLFAGTRAEAIFKWRSNGGLFWWRVVGADGLEVSPAILMFG